MTQFSYKLYGQVCFKTKEVEKLFLPVIFIIPDSSYIHCIQSGDIFQRGNIFIFVHVTTIEFFAEFICYYMIHGKWCPADIIKWNCGEYDFVIRPLET